jgi:NAD(P)-dependent dehydrogenase (short-subunit alcohol dehydrogenase family)
MKNKIILITGASDGIGKQTALELAKIGATIFVHGRNPLRTQQAVDEIRQKSNNSRVESIVADLGSFKQTRQMAEYLLTHLEHLDVLINNAGVFMEERTLTEDGLETTFQVNHLAYFLLGNLLLPLLKAAPQGRMVNVASRAHFSIRQLDLENLQGEKRYDGRYAYNLSKLGNLFFTYELSRRLKGSPVTVNALHPGEINTKLLNAGWNIQGADLPAGASTPVYLASSPIVANLSGKYFENQAETRSSSLSYDISLWTQFWEVSTNLSGL